MGWPRSPGELERVQGSLAVARPDPWRPSAHPVVAGVWFTAPTGSPGERSGEPAWVAAVALHLGTVVSEAVLRGRTGAGYAAGLLALREGPLLERAVGALAYAPDVVVVNATGRDHPRGAGLALHLGAVLALPTVGVTDRPLLARATAAPGPHRGDRRPLVLDGVVVADLVRTREGARPVCVHPGWRTDREIAVALILSLSGPARTAEPLRVARRLARMARAADQVRGRGGDRVRPRR